MLNLKNILCTAIGIVGTAESQLFGGWSAALTTLIIFMGIDYISGVIVAGVFHKSTKTKKQKKRRKRKDRNKNERTR